MPEVPPPWPTEVMVDRRTGSTAGCWSLAEARREDPRGCRGRSVWPAPAGISVHTSSSAPFAKGGLERLAWPPAVPLLAVTEAWRSARSPAPLRPVYSLVLVSPFSLTLPPPGRSLTGDSARLRRITTGPISVSLPTHPEKGPRPSHRQRQRFSSLRPNLMSLAGLIRPVSLITRRLPECRATWPTAAAPGRGCRWLGRPQRR
jgi:hypothetical protein